MGMFGSRGGFNFARPPVLHDPKKDLEPCGNRDDLVEIVDLEVPKAAVDVSTSDTESKDRAR